jgi:hypothetical protein
LATIGSITVAFSASLDEFETGIEEVSDLLDGLSDSVDDISAKIAGSSKTIKVKTVVDSKQVEAAADKIESTSATIKVTASLEKPESVAEEVKKATGKGKDNKVTFLANVTDVIAKAAEAGKATAIFKRTIVAPIVATTNGVSEAIGFGKQLVSAYSLSATSVTDFARSLSSANTAASGLRESVVVAFGLSSAWNASSEAATGATKSIGNIFTSLGLLSKESQNQTKLAEAIATGGAEFASTAASASLYEAAMAAVNKATEDLDPKLKAATRGLAALALTALQAEAKSRLSAAATDAFRSALTSQASPLAAVVAGVRSYTAGMAEIAASSTAAVDRQRALIRIQNVLSQVFTNTKSAVSGLFAPLITGFSRAREAGDGYAASLIRGLSGQANSIGIVRSAAQSLGNAFEPFISGFSRSLAAGNSFFAAFDRGIASQLQSIGLFRAAMSGIGSAFNATGLSAFFEPLITGFARATAAGQGFVAAIARGVGGQLQSSAAFRALSASAVAAGQSIAAFGSSIVDAISSTQLGRSAYSAYSATLRAVGSTLSDVSARLGVFKSSISAAFQALPAGNSIVASLSNAFRSLTASTSGAASSLPTIGKVMSSLGPLMAVAGVATGRFAQQLTALTTQAQSIEQMKERFDSTSQEMEILAYAAESAGVGMGQLAKASQTFMANVSKVRIGQLNSEPVIEAKFAFDRLKISIDDLRGADPNELFGSIAEKLLDVPDAADRAAIAFDLFGKQAVNILPALRGLKEAKDDATRLGLATSKIDFSRILEAEASFDRVAGASKALSRTMLTTFAPIQTGWNNMMADFKGGIVAALGPIRTMMAAAFVPMQVFMEIIGRVVNILLRMVGVVTTVFAALAGAGGVANAWQAIGSAVKEAMEYVEYGVNVAQQIASAFADSVTPAIEEGATAFDRLAFGVQVLGTLIVTTGITSAVMETFGIQAGAMAMKFLKSMASLKGAQAAFAFISAGIKLVTFDLIVMGSNFVKQIAVRSVTAIAIGLQSFLGYVAGLIVGNAAITVSSTATGYAMAAAWIIGTLGIAAIIVVIIAVIQNMDKLYSWFENFGANVGKLFTFGGLYDAASAVAEAIKNVFMGMLNAIAGFLSGIWANIKKAVLGVKAPPKIDAATSSVEAIVASRGANRSANAAIGDQKAMRPEAVEDLTASISGARQGMIGMSLEASKFGEKGRKAFLAARTDFDKLQQRLADGTLDPKKFEEETLRIQKSLNENLSLADVLSPEQMQESAEQMRKSVEDAMAKVREVSRGQDLGSDLSADRFFPTSDAVNQAAEGFSKEYESSLMAIESKLQSGGFGKGQQALKDAQKAKEQVESDFNRNMGKITADVSFASDIRKALEDAFLSPLQAYEKNLKKIMDNKSLSPEEKTRATAMEQKKMVEGTFGKTSGQSFREKEEMLASASSSGAFAQAYGGNKVAGAARESSERNKMNMDRRSAAGLDPSASQKLKAGADNIADVFNVTGKSMDEIRAQLGPEKFAEFQEAMKKNSDAVKASLGVQQPAIAKYRELQEKLAQAVKDDTISKEEAAAASRRSRDDLMSSIGVTKTPFEEFSGSIDNIAEQFGMVGKPLDEVRKSLEGNAADLALFDKAVKNARDNLLSSLGIEKSPQQVFEESMKKIEEAANSTDKDKRITPEQAAEARKAQEKKRDEALGAGNTPQALADQAAKRKKEIEEAYGVGGSKDPAKYKTAMDELGKSLPGAEEQSPVQKFKDEMSQLKALKSSGTIDDKEFAERRMQLQAKLQEDTKESVDAMRPDRRGIEASDNRSKSGVDTFFRLLRGGDNPSLKAQLDAAKNTKRLVELAEEPDAAPVIQNIQGRG